MVMLPSLASIKENDMPLIEVHVIENVFNAEQKRQMISKLTDAMVSIEGEAMRGVTWVKISEVASGDWGIGGKSLTRKPSRSLHPDERWPDALRVASPAGWSCRRCCGSLPYFDRSRRRVRSSSPLSARAERC